MKNLRELSLSSLCNLASLQRNDGNMRLVALDQGISKPAVSKSISLLERTLGLSLIQTDPTDQRRKTLTPVGKALAKATEAYLDELSTVLRR